MTLGEIFLELLAGSWVTIAVTAYAMLFAAPFALGFGILQHLTGGVAWLAVTGAIEFWRGSSVIVLLLVFFYVLPFAGLRLDPYTVAALVLGLNMGGYGSQVVQGALAAVDRGQLEAARSLGLPRILALWKVEMPQAFPQMLPTFINELIELVKLSALVSLITLSDPTFRAKQIFQITYKPLEVYGCLLFLYFCIGYPIAVYGRRLEQRMSRSKTAPT